MPTETARSISGLIDPDAAPGTPRAADAARAAMGAAAVSRVGMFLPLPCVSNRVSRFDNSGSAGANVQQATSRTSFVAAFDASSLRVAYCNYYLAGGTEENAPANSFTIKAAIWDSSGNGPFVLSFGGRRTATLEPYGRVLSDPVAVDARAGSRYYIHTYVDNTPSFNAIPIGFYTSASLTEGYKAGDNADINTGFQASNTNVFGPAAVIGSPADGRPRVSLAIFGDSILAGTGEATNYTGNGFGVRFATANNFGVVWGSRSGETVYSMATFPYQRTIRLSLMSGCNYLLSDFGTNDVGNGRTLSQIQADLLTFWGACSRHGLRVVHSTITPRTKSTDSWATVANQYFYENSTSGGSLHAQEDVRKGLNSWLRDTSASGAIQQSGGTLWGVADTAAAVEVNSGNVLTPNGGYWQVNGSAGYPTADGIHPTSTFHAIMAGAVPVSLFGAY